MSLRENSQKYRRVTLPIARLERASLGPAGSATTRRPQSARNLRGEVDRGLTVPQFTFPSREPPPTPLALHRRAVLLSCPSRRNNSSETPQSSFQRCLTPARFRRDSDTPQIHSSTSRATPR